MTISSSIAQQSQKNKKSTAHLKVAIVVHQSVALFELGCAVELFSLKRPEIESWYQTDVVSFNNQSLAATGGIELSVKKVKTLTHYDMLVIPCWPVDQAVPDNLAAAVLSFHKAGGRILSFCSGAFLLAEIGILENRKAITHWRYADQFKQKYPTIEYVDDVLYVYDKKIGCSAGSAAAFDLGLEIIRQDFGYQVANSVARRLVLAAHRSGGQSQFIETPLIKNQSYLAATLDWAIENLDQKISVAALANQARMSRRTFDRKFRQSLNMSAKEWLVKQRIEKVKQLLESSDQSIEWIAIKSGFENAMTLRHHFRKYLGLSPSQFKLQFSAS